MPLVAQLRIVVLLSTVVLFVGSSISAQNSQRIHVKEIMSPQQFRAAGLNKLTPTELAALDTALDVWVDKYSDALIKSAMQSPIMSGPSAPPTTGNAIESTIDGDFNGWEGETIFKLSNGQIWQQAEYDYEYEYAYRPDVTIYRTSTCWKMAVEGMDDKICVKRLK